MKKAFFLFLSILVFVSVTIFLFHKNSVTVIEPTLEVSEVRLLFGGDMMFDRSIRQSMEKRGSDFIFSPLKDLLHSYDAVVANLEGPITTFSSESVNSPIGSPKNFVFTFAPSVAQMLAEHNVRLVSIGNNHIGNFGVDGIRQTKSFLKESNVEYFGYTGQEKELDERVVFLNLGGRRFAFVGVNQFVPSGWEIGLDDIRGAKKQAEVVVVLPHWGNEYEPKANAVIQEMAHAFIEAGADLIIGSHPHVVQQSELYQGKKIYYSLGNLVFDQYFSAETQRGLLVGVTFKIDGTQEFSEIPVRLRMNGQTALLER